MIISDNDDELEESAAGWQREFMSLSYGYRIKEIVVMINRI